MRVGGKAQIYHTGHLDEKNSVHTCIDTTQLLKVAIHLLPACTLLGQLTGIVLSAQRVLYIRTGNKTPVNEIALLQPKGEVLYRSNHWSPSLTIFD